MTREEKNANWRRWYWANREKVASLRKKFRGANPEKVKEWQQNYLLKHGDARRAWEKEYRERNREKRRLQDMAWKQANRAKVNRQTRARTKANRAAANAAAKRARLKGMERPSYRVLANVRRRILKVLKGVNKSKKTLDLLGCAKIEDFKIYVESKWETGMKWENYGTGAGRWNLDHIIPCAIFDLAKPEHQKRCFHFSNIQPMWSEKNSSKGDRVVTNQFNLL